MATSGYSWVKGTELAYIDGAGAKRVSEGTDEGFLVKNFSLDKVLIGSSNWKGLYWTASDNDYAQAHSSSVGTLTKSNNWLYASQWQSGNYSIRRGLLFLDISELESHLPIEEAKLPCSIHAWATAGRAFFAVLVDGTNVPYDETGYGVLEDRTTWLGSCYIPLDYNDYGTIDIVLNSAGIEYLENHAGEEAVPLGLRLSTDINISAPPAGNSEMFSLALTNFTYEGVPYLATYLQIAPNRAAAGYLWVEESSLTYGDATFHKRLIEGTLTGLTGKTPGQISINTKAPMLGTHYCYIDGTGAERCFEGT